MAQYRYNGQVLVKNSKREDFKYACIEQKEDGEIIKIQISSTYDGAGAEKRRMISRCRESIMNYKRAIKAVEDGRDYYTASYDNGKHHQKYSITWYKEAPYVPEERKALTPIDY